MCVHARATSSLIRRNNSKPACRRFLRLISFAFQPNMSLSLMQTARTDIIRLSTSGGSVRSSVGPSGLGASHEKGLSMI